MKNKELIKEVLTYWLRKSNDMGDRGFIEETVERVKHPHFNELKNAIKSEEWVYE